MSDGDLTEPTAEETPTVPGHRVRRDPDGWYTAVPEDGKGASFRGPDQAALTRQHHERLYVRIRARRHFLT